MFNFHLLALTGLLLAVLLATPHNGGLVPGLLLSIYSSLLFTLCSLGPSAWRLIRNSSTSSDSNWQSVFICAALLYGVGLAAAVIASPMPALAAEQGLAMGLLPAGYLVARACLRAGLDWVHVWGVFRLVASALAVMALGERLLTGTRAYALFSDPNVLAGLFNVFILFQFATVAAQIRQGRTRNTEIALLALFAAAQGVTGSLSGLLCLLAALLPLVLLSSWRQPARRALLLLGIAGAVTLLVIAGSGGTKETPTTKLQGIAQHSSFTVRVEMARSSLAIYRDSSWYGSGLGTYKLYYPRYRSTLDTGTTGDLAHNDYVQFLQEGGPLLLGSLLMLALIVSVRTAGTIRESWRAGPTADGLTQVGIGSALLALLLHAGMNFIFYVAPMALLFGVLLARLAPAPEPSGSPVSSGGSKLVFTVVILALTTMLLATLGARALFLGLTRETCQLQLCQVLRPDVAFTKKITAYLAGTQPTWVPAREYLMNNYLNTEQTASDAAEKQRWRVRAFREASTVVEDIPEIWNFYVHLAEMITRDASLATALPQGLPTEPEGLYRLALTHNPFDLPTRLKVIQALQSRGKGAEAYAAVQQIMPFWYLWELGDGGRMRLLNAGIPLAVSLHKCQEANEMAEGLKVFLQLQREAADKGGTLPTPPNGIYPPSAEEAEKTLALVARCH